jgi:hypothetical protein
MSSHRLQSATIPIKMAKNDPDEIVNTIANAIMTRTQMRSSLVRLLNKKGEGRCEHQFSVRAAMNFQSCNLSEKVAMAALIFPVAMSSKPLTMLTFLESSSLSNVQEIGKWERWCTSLSRLAGLFMEEEIRKTPQSWFVHQKM